MNNQNAQFMQTMREQLRETLEVVHFDEAISIIEQHITKMIEESELIAGGEQFANRLRKLQEAIGEYREERLEETVPGYSTLRNK